MDSFLLSTGVVAVAELGDKTQLLALLLAARFRQPLPIAAGIAAATLANHALAGAAGAWMRDLLTPELLRWFVAASFLALGAWALTADRCQGVPGGLDARFGAFLVTLVGFFLAEMGDKTQAATVALAARSEGLVAVVLGTSLGMMLANLPPLWLGTALAARIPLRAVRLGAALLFVLLGLLALAFGGGSWRR